MTICLDYAPSVYNRYVLYNLKKDKITVKAILIAWLNGHTAVFTLYGDLFSFKTGDTIKVNMNTLWASPYECLIREEAV